ALFLALILFFVWLLISAQGALIKATADAALGRTVSAWRSLVFASRSFWQLLSIRIVTRLLAFFIAAVVGLPLLAVILSFDESFTIVGSSLIFFVLVLPLFILFSLVGKLALAYSLVEGKPWRRALTQAMSLFGAHWLVCLELALIMLPINIIAAVIFVPIATFLSLPLLLFGLAIAEASFVIGLKFFLALALVLFLLLLLLFASALATFQGVVWTVLFLKIKDAPQQSKLIRILHNWREKYGN
ncbi:MAG: hypothetical protein Q8L21_00815, partial [Candidatus Komeilibacteria bacterium]|nr:hypothetical protein [Candidatus Komeilibacteria bacterium]